jgi:hypothetical protein
MTKYRVTWTDTKSGNAQAIDVRTLVTATNMADTLARAVDTADITVSIHHVGSFNEMSLHYAKR